MAKKNAAVSAIVDNFVERLEEVVERSQDAIWQAVPSYARSGENLQTDVRHAVRSNVGSLAQVLHQSREVKREELEGIERVGARRAQQGLPLDDVLHAYRTVSRVCCDALAD